SSSLRAAHLSSTSPLSYNAPAPPETYPLSLHDALPISCHRRRPRTPARPCRADSRRAGMCRRLRICAAARWRPDTGRESERRSRSEEHTSELQSRFDLVCRLLLEKKKSNKNIDQERM